MRICSIEGGCERKHYARGLCRYHYNIWYNTEGVYADKIRQYQDPEEAFAARTEWQGDCLIWTGGVDGDGYGSIVDNGNTVGAHRYAWERVYGEIPEGKSVDHKDHCSKACVNTKHLRLATRQQNNWNRGKHNSSSGHRNVYKKGNKWVVQIRKDYKLHNFGAYSNLEEAAKVAEEKRLELYGEFAGRG